MNKSETSSGQLILRALVAFYAVILLLDGWYHPVFCDEASFLKNVCYFGVYRTAEPIFTNYPTFFSYLLAGPIYLVYLFVYIFVRRYPLDGLDDPRLFALVFQGELDIWLWVARLISILLAARILVLVYKYCVDRFCGAAAMTAIVLLVTSPYYFYLLYARYALPDIFVAFIVTWIMFKAAKHLEEPDSRGLHRAAFWAGLAASAKLNGVVALLPLLAVPFIAPASIKNKVSFYFYVLIYSFAGFFVGSPYIILKPELYTAGFGLESQLLVSQSMDVFPQWLVAALWREDPAMTLLLGIALFYSVLRRKKQEMLFHALLIPSVIFLGGMAKRSPHYLLFLFPWLCVIVASFLHDIVKFERLKLLRWCIIALMVCLLAFETHKLTGRIMADHKPDNRTLAREWIKKNISTDAHILFDWDNVPSMGLVSLRVMSNDEYINKNKYKSIVSRYFPQPLHFYVSYLPTFDISIEELKRQGWQYFVTANYCLDPYLHDPSGLDAVEHGDSSEFVGYLLRRSFYLSVLQNQIGVQAFTDGSGPRIYVYKLQEVRQ